MDDDVVVAAVAAATADVVVVLTAYAVPLLVEYAVLPDTVRVSSPTSRRICGPV